MLSHFILLVCCSVLVGDVTASKPLKILVLETDPFSYHMWTMHLVKGLLRKGHHVHAVSLQETKVKGKLAQNLTYSVLEELMKSYEKAKDYNPVVPEWEQYNVFYLPYFIYQMGIYTCNSVIKTKEAKELLEMIKTVEYDVIVQDVAVTQCLYGLWEVAKGKPSVVGYIPLYPTLWFKDFIGGPSYPIVRHYTHAPVAEIEDFWLRIWNIYFDILLHYYYFPNVQRMAEEFMGHSIRPLREIQRDSINIILLNTHAAFDTAISLPPNILEIAGLNAQDVQPIEDEVVETYPENVREFLDGAKNGAIVISLRTNVKCKSFGLDKIKAVILALSKLKQRVLWKLDIDIPLEIPDNVMIMKWIPQREVLSHKNIRAVWTHGGFLSTQEAIWIGVPIIAMPFFTDPTFYTQILVAKGVGVFLDVKTLSTQSILHAFEEILYNESYTRNMKQLSSEFRDRPIPPLDLAVWGIEYAVRHPNGSLATPLRSQSWVEQNLIVYAVLFLISFKILLSIYFVIIKLRINLFDISIYNCCCKHIRSTFKRKSKQS